MKLSLNQKGFTITELTISMGVATIVSAILLTIMIVFYGNILKNDARSRMTVDSQIILRNIVDELRVASSIRDVNNIADPYAPGGTWQTSSDEAILIISLPALDSSREFIIDENGDPYQNEIVYFSEGTTMYRRYLSNPAASGNTGVTNCPESDSTPSCPPDRVVSQDFEDMEFVLYDRDNEVTTDPLLARSVEMTILLQRSIYGEDISSDSNIRITMRNYLP